MRMLMCWTQRTRTANTSSAHVLSLDDAIEQRRKKYFLNNTGVSLQLFDIEQGHGWQLKMSQWKLSQFFALKWNKSELSTGDTR